MANQFKADYFNQQPTVSTMYMYKLYYYWHPNLCHTVPWLSNSLCLVNVHAVMVFMYSVHCALWIGQSIFIELSKCHQKYIVALNNGNKFLSFVFMYMYM